MTAKLDRRILRTRALLREALLALIVERGYDVLTVEDITERADLRRATFYQHYANKDDLLFTVLDETFLSLVQQMSQVNQGLPLAGKTHYQAFQVSFDHAQAYHQLYRSLFTSQVGGAVAQRIRDFLAQLIEQALLAEIPPAALKMPPPIIAQSIAALELGLLQWWLEQERPYSSEEMARFMHQWVWGGLLAAFSPAQGAILLPQLVPQLSLVKNHTESG